MKDIGDSEEFLEVMACLEAGDEKKWQETVDLLCRKGLTCQDDSAEILGHLFEFGQGVEQDLKEALAWYSRDKWFYMDHIERCLEKVEAVDPEFEFRENMLPK
ncbi:MAG: sel1 repeat family protein, partial [Agathobacter sp.]|nr:sel1 repeat family protein [Agathobacter sp.]